MSKIELDSILKLRIFAVAGASRDPKKYGNKIFHSLLEHGYEVFPINPTVAEVDGYQTFPDLASVPFVPEVVSIVTPPEATKQIVDQAIELGVKAIWMQPGAQEESASEKARQAGIIVVDDGSCILVELAAMN